MSMTTRYWVFNEEQLIDVLDEAIDELGPDVYTERSELVQAILNSDTFREAGLMKESAE